MNNGIAEIKEPIMASQQVITSPGLLNIQSDLSGNHETIDKLIAEGGESLYNYVKWLGLTKDPNLIVLPSVHHYYFDNNDFKNINTLVNLKQLNQIKDIAGFFQSIIKIIPSNSNFIGCFLDNKTQYRNANKNTLSQYQLNHRVDPFENGITSRSNFLNTAYNYMDSKTNRYLTKKNVSTLLNKQGFKVLDMKELNGLTYFHTQKPREYMAA
jgi:F0F1-type ATP synthase gamma subunit